MKPRSGFKKYINKVEGNENGTPDISSSEETGRRFFEGVVHFNEHRAINSYEYFREAVERIERQHRAERLSRQAARYWGRSLGEMGLYESNTLSSGETTEQVSSNSVRYRQESEPDGDASPMARYRTEYHRLLRQYRRDISSRGPTLTTRSR